MFMLNLKLSIYCLFSDILFVTDSEKNLRDGMQFYYLNSLLDAIEKEQLQNAYNLNSAEFVYVKWLKTVIDEQMAVSEIVAEKEGNRSVSSHILERI